MQTNVFLLTQALINTAMMMPTTAEARLMQENHSKCPLALALDINKMCLNVYMLDALLVFRLVAVNVHHCSKVSTEKKFHQEPGILLNQKLLQHWFCVKTTWVSLASTAPGNGMRGQDVRAKGRMRCRQ